MENWRYLKILDQENKAVKHTIDFIEALKALQCIDSILMKAANERAALERVDAALLVCY